MAAVAVPSAYVAGQMDWRDLRDAVAELSPDLRALVIGAAVALYVIAMVPVVALLLTSARLDAFRTLPLSRAFWRRLHARHLLTANALGVGAVALGVTALASVGLRVAWATALVALLLAVQVAWRAEPRRVRRIALLVGAGAAVSVAVRLGSPWPLGALAIPAAAWAHRRLAGPMPEPPRTRVAWPTPRRPAVAFAILLARIVRRRSGGALTTVLLGQASVVMLAGLAVRHAPHDPATTSLLRGLAVVGAVVGAALMVPAWRGLARDRWLLDATPLRLREATLGWIVLGVLAAAPSALLAVERGVAGALDWVAATGFAVLATAWVMLGAAVRRQPTAPVLPRLLAALLAAQVAVAAAGSTWPLAAVALGLALGLPSRSRAADVARRRFETHVRDDDHDT